MKPIEKEEEEYVYTLSSVRAYTLMNVSDLSAYIYVVCMYAFYNYVCIIVQHLKYIWVRLSDFPIIRVPLYAYSG